MLIRHLASGLLLGIGSAVWGWSDGYSAWAVLGLYSLGGAVGIVGSAAVLAFRD
jgi:hypothetical protein